MQRDEFSEIAACFNPEHPTNMPETLLHAAKHVYVNRLLKTRNAFSQYRFNRNFHGNKKAAKEPNFTQEEILKNICGSGEVANSAAELEQIKPVPIKLWIELLMEPIPLPINWAENGRNGALT